MPDIHLTVTEDEFQQIRIALRARRRQQEEAFDLGHTIGTRLHRTTRLLDKLDAADPERETAETPTA